MRGVTHFCATHSDGVEPSGRRHNNRGWQTVQLHSAFQANQAGMWSDWQEGEILIMITWFPWISGSSRLDMFTILFVGFLLGGALTCERNVGFVNDSG